MDTQWVVALAYSTPIAGITLLVMSIGEELYEVNGVPGVCKAIRILSITVITLLVVFCCSFYAERESILAIGLGAWGAAILLAVIGSYLVARSLVYRKQHPKLPRCWRGARKTVQLGIVLGMLLGSALIYAGQSGHFETLFRQLGMEEY